MSVTIATRAWVLTLQPAAWAPRRGFYPARGGQDLVTGGAGLVGSRVARLLVERGDELRLAVRSSTRLDNLDFEYQTVACGILDRQAVRRALRGVERVFHVAASRACAPPPASFPGQRGGHADRHGEALPAGVERVVHTSSIAAIGPAPPGRSGQARDIPGGGCAIPYVDAKREAEVRSRLAARGLPVVIVNPAFVLGAGDYSGPRPSWCAFPAA